MSETETVSVANRKQIMKELSIKFGHVMNFASK